MDSEGWTRARLRPNLAQPARLSAPQPNLLVLTSTPLPMPRCWGGSNEGSGPSWGWTGWVGGRRADEVDGQTSGPPGGGGDRARKGPRTIRVGPRCVWRGGRAGRVGVGRGGGVAAQPARRGSPFLGDGGAVTLKTRITAHRIHVYRCDGASLRLQSAVPCGSARCCRNITSLRMACLRPVTGVDLGARVVDVMLEDEHAPCFGLDADYCAAASVSMSLKSQSLNPSLRYSKIVMNERSVFSRS